MRLLPLGLVVGVLAAGLSGTATAQDDFMGECRVTASEKMCQCIYANMPADQRAAALAGMRKSNAAVRAGGAPLDPSTLTPEQMQGLNAVVVAQAACT
jgi:hypothetical protein